MTDQELDARFNSLAAEIKAEIKTEGVVTRRRFDVVADGLKADIKIIADGHAALTNDVAGLKAGQERLEQGQERLEIRQLAIEHRQGKLEERQESLEQSQNALVDAQRDLVTEVRLLAGRLA